MNYSKRKWVIHESMLFHNVMIVVNSQYSKPILKPSILERPSCFDYSVSNNFFNHFSRKANKNKNKTHTPAKTYIRVHQNPTDT